MWTRVSMMTCDWTISVMLWKLLLPLVILLQTLQGSQTQLTDDETPLLRVATIQREPFVYLRWEPGLIANDRYEGMYIDLLKELARESGFQYQLYLVPDGRIGQQGDDGRWNGLMGELERGIADLVLTPVINTMERQNIASFTEPLSPVRISALTKKQAGGSGPQGAPFGVVVSSEAFFALRSQPGLFESLQQSHGVIYVNSLMEGLDRAREGHLKLLLTSQLADYHVDQEPCDLVSEDFHRFPPEELAVGLAMRGDSPVRSRINAALHRIRMGTNILEHLESRWLRGSCSHGGTLPTLPDTTTNTGQAENKKCLVIASMVTEPYLMRSSKRGVEFEGYIADLIRQMARVVPFEYEWKIQRKFGRQRRDGSWTGVVGDLISQKADMAAAPFVSDHDQEEYLSFSKPFLESTLSILLQDPPPGRHLPIMMAEDLLNQSAYDFGVVHKSRVAKQLKRSQLPLYKKLWKELKVKDRENKILTISHGLDKVRSGNFALLMESPEATYLSSRSPCDLLSLSQYLSVTNYAFAFKKDSPLVEDLNNALLQLQQDGVLQALFHKWWNTDECLEYHRTRVPTDPPESTTRANTPSTTTNSTETNTYTPVPLKPVLDFDLDAMLGLSTAPYQDQEESYQDVHGSDDMDRIFLTSPVSAFTPKRPMETPTTPTRPEITKPWQGLTSTSNNHMNESHINVGIPLDRDNDTSIPKDNDVIFYTVPTTTELMRRTTPRRRHRTRRPGRKRHRNKKTTPSLTTTHQPSLPPTPPPTPPPDPPNTNPPDFIKDIEWFFATEQPRIEDYDYNNFNLTDNDTDSYTPFIPQQNFTHIKQDTYTTSSTQKSSPNVQEIYTTSPERDILTVKVTNNIGASNITSTPTVPNIHSSSAPSEGSSKAVLFVIIVHLLIFGWPPTTQNCTEDCNR